MFLLISFRKLIKRRKSVACIFAELLKETIMHEHDRHNTTLLSIIHNISTTCFGQYYFWPSSCWIQLSEETTQYIIWYSITISVGVSTGGRDLVYKIFGWLVRRRFKILAPELFFLILAHPVYKMWIIQEPNTLELWNELHFEEKKTESIYHV